MTEYEDLRRIDESAGGRRGWDFRRASVERDPVPWDYLEVVRKYLRPDSRVLDIGTGGGERFLSLAPDFGQGIGCDPDPAMLQAARENTPDHLRDRVRFEQMAAEELRYPDGSFDVVLNRHATIFVPEIVRVLRPGGYFLTQQVGARNTRNICHAFGCAPSGEAADVPWPSALIEVAREFTEQGCAVIGRGEYDVRYWFRDVESFVFWLKAIPMPTDFSMIRHWQIVSRLIDEFTTPTGIETNEHRELLIGQRH